MTRTNTVRVAVLIVSAAALIGYAGGQASAEGESAPRSFKVGARQFRYSARPFMMGGRLMVPLKETMKAMGVKVSGSTQRAGKLAFTCRGRKVRVMDASGTAVVGEEKWTLTRPATRRTGDIFVPAAFIKRLDSRYAIRGL